MRQGARVYACTPHPQLLLQPRLQSVQSSHSQSTGQLDFVQSRSSLRDRILGVLLPARELWKTATQAADSEQSGTATVASS